MVIDVENGVENPLRAYLKLVELKKDIEKAIDYIKDYAINEASKYEKGAEIDGKRLVYSRGRAMYDFSKIGAWIEAKERLKEVEDYYKTLYLAKSKTGFDNVNIDSGEIAVLPEVTYTSDYIKIERNG